MSIPVPIGAASVQKIIDKHKGRIGKRMGLAASA